MSLTQLISAAITGSTIDATPIGQTTPAAAKFTTPALLTDNSQNAATTAWVQSLLANSPSGNGWVQIGAIIIQWGHVATDINSGTLPVTFPIVFPNNAFVVAPVTLSATDRITYVVNGSLTRTGFTIGNNGSGGFAYWIAIGD